jgi:hypothetical protein
VNLPQQVAHVHVIEADAEDAVSRQALPPVFAARLRRLGRRVAPHVNFTIKKMEIRFDFADASL